MKYFIYFELVKIQESNYYKTLQYVIGFPLYLETWKNLKFLTVLTCSAVKFRFDSDNMSYKKDFLSSKNFFVKKHF